jgi:hypothetical protein
MEWSACAVLAVGHLLHRDLLDDLLDDDDLSVHGDFLDDLLDHDLKA